MFLPGDPLPKGKYFGFLVEYRILASGFFENNILKNRLVLKRSSVFTFIHAIL